MTDQLELLLENEEEKEENIPDLFTHNGHGPARRRRHGTTEEEGGVERSAAVLEGTAPSGKAETGMEKPGGRRVEETLLDGMVSRLFSALPGGKREGGQLETTGLSPERQGARAGRDLQAARGSVPFAQRFYDGLLRAERAADYQKPQGRDYLPLVKPEERRAEGVFREADALDRIFQRDARRYDRGFAWQ